MPISTQLQQLKANMASAVAGMPAPGEAQSWACMAVSSAARLSSADSSSACPTMPDTASVCTGCTANSRAASRASNSCWG